MGTGIRAADPDEHLHRALCMNGMHRLRRAKALTVESPCFQAVPAAARDRFLHLLQAVPDTAGNMDADGSLIALRRSNLSCSICV
jgi:hypothetical protein